MSVRTAVPIDTSLRLYGSTQSQVLSDIFSIMRLARLHNAIEITKPLHRVVQRAAIYFPPFEPISRMFAMIITCIYITHIMACMLYINGHPLFDDPKQCQEHGHCGWVTQQDWQAYHESEGGGLMSQIAVAKYITALYYASTQITTGKQAHHPSVAAVHPLRPANAVGH